MKTKSVLSLNPYDSMGPILQAIKRLRSECIITEYKLDRSRSRGLSLFFKLTLTGEEIPLERRYLLTRFVVDAQECRPEIETKARFEVVFLPPYPQLADSDKIYEELRSKIGKRRRGYWKEKLLLEAGLYLKERNCDVLRCYLASPYDDKFLGTDLWLVMLNHHGSETGVPINSKGDTSGQAKHKERFPEIPSVLVRAHETTRERATKLLKIGRSYLRGQILHL